MSPHWPLTFSSLTSGLHCSDGGQFSRPWWLRRDAVLLLPLLPGFLTLDNSSLCSLRFPGVCSTWSACWVSLVKVQTAVLNLNRLRAVVPAHGFLCSRFLSSNTSVKARAAATHGVSQFPTVCTFLFFLRIAQYLLIYKPMDSFFRQFLTCCWALCWDNLFI